ncbi:MAG: LysM peptidoglycan-binding domain-containing protein [Oscillospiraceae bacterium]|nr:LysM peptidoglycan-binding domain-containing protein [Oscillospiraceae bacterium]
MSYRIFIDRQLMPVTPGRISVRYRGQNRRTALLDGGELTRLRAGEGAELSFTLMLPRRRYPFARYDGRFSEPERFLERFLALRERRQPFRFICARISPAGRLLTDTNLRVSLESLELVECAENGGDLTVQLTLREYREHRAARVVSERHRVIIEGPARETDNRPVVPTHTVVRGDTLWGIARRHLGDGRRYREIFELNRDQIRNPNLIFPGQVLRLPVA